MPALLHCLELGADFFEEMTKLHRGLLIGVAMIFTTRGFAHGTKRMCWGLGRLSFLIEFVFEAPRSKAAGIALAMHFQDHFAIKE
jgi:hypothetical protein